MGEQRLNFDTQQGNFGIKSFDINGPECIAAALLFIQNLE